MNNNKVVWDIPSSALHTLESTAKKLKHGTAELSLHIRDTLLSRYATRREGTLIAEGGFSGYVPIDAVQELRLSKAGVTHGIISLVLVVCNGELERFYTTREESFLPAGEKSSEAAV
jgi:hypothetical protein